MPNEIKALYTTGYFVMTGLNGLLNSPTYFTGWMSDLVNNTSTKFQQVTTYVRLNLGTSPTANSAGYVFAIRGDTHAGAVTHVTDGGSTKFTTADTPTGQGRIVMLNAPMIGVLASSPNAATDDSVWGEYTIEQPGPYFGLGIVNSFGSALDTTGNWARWIGVNPEIQ